MVFFSRTYMHGRCTVLSKEMKTLCKHGFSSCPEATKMRQMYFPPPPRLRMNLEKVDSLVEEELEVCLAPSPNPFCSLLPARIPTGFAFRRFKRRSVVMSNDFICVVKWDKEEEGKK